MTVSTRRPRIVPATPRILERAKTERRQRRRARARRVGYPLGGLFVVLLCGWLATSTPILAVRSVAVEGASRLTKAQVQEAAAARLGTPLARVDVGAISRRVGALPGVASVSVTRGWPWTLRIAVVERTPVAAVRWAGRWALIDATGAPFAEVDRQPVGFAVLDILRPGPQDDATRSALAVLVSLPPALRAQVTSLRAPTPSGVLLVLGSGQAVLWGSPGEAQTKAAAAEALLAKGARTVDVSSPGMVTTRSG